MVLGVLKEAGVKKYAIDIWMMLFIRHCLPLLCFDFINLIKSTNRTVTGLFMVYISFIMKLNHNLIIDKSIQLTGLNC